MNGSGRFAGPGGTPCHEHATGSFQVPDEACLPAPDPAIRPKTAPMVRPNPAR